MKVKETMCKHPIAFSLGCVGLGVSAVFAIGGIGYKLGKNCADLKWANGILNLKEGNYIKTVLPAKVDGKNCYEVIDNLQEWAEIVHEVLEAANK